MKKIIYCVFFALTSCTFSTQKNEINSVLIEENKDTILIKESIPSLILIGYINDIPIFGDAESNDFYSFDGEFRFYKKGRSGFLPVYCNDSVMIYVSRKNDRILSNEVIIAIGQVEKKILLPSKEVAQLVSNMNGDTLFYTNGDNEVDNIRIFDAINNKETIGTSVWYEGFWYSKGLFYYYLPNKEDYRSYLYTTSVPPIEKGTFIANTPVDNMDAISYDGNYLAGDEKFSKKLYCVVNLKTGEFKRKIIKCDNTIFSFFYKNKAYFYNTSTLKIEDIINLDDI